MAFQLIDDTLDYTSAVTAKTRLADLHEGKLTLPLVLSVEKDPSLLEPVLAIHRGDESTIDDVGRRVVESGACDQVRSLAASYTREAVLVLREVPPSQARGLLENVATHLSERDR
jgi:octaprenyl-diphosphate synthase